MKDFELETIEECNCINCRMGRMERNMETLHLRMTELVSALSDSPIIRSN